MAKTPPPTTPKDADAKDADAPATASAPAPTGKSVKSRDDVQQTRKVRATAPCYYNDESKRTGDVFCIRPPYTIDGITYDEFSKAMEDVDEDTPEHTTTGKEQLRKEHDEIMASRRPQGMNVLGD
jgi:hypothetical protein